jgi:hypothetical protein
MMINAVRLLYLEVMLFQLFILKISQFLALNMYPQLCCIYNPLAVKFIQFICQVFKELSLGLKIIIIHFFLREKN